MSDISITVVETPQQVTTEVVSNSVTVGTPGLPGPGVPGGGVTGQILTKTDNTDFNTEWTSIIDGGTFN
jgi:hypothetical protein